MLQKAAQINTQRVFEMLFGNPLDGLEFEPMSFEVSAAFSWSQHINDNFPFVLFPLLRHTVRTQWQDYLREKEVTPYVTYHTIFNNSINETICCAQFGSVFMSPDRFRDRSWTVISCVSCQYQLSESVCLKSFDDFDVYCWWLPFESIWK